MTGNTVGQLPLSPAWWAYCSHQPTAAEETWAEGRRGSLGLGPVKPEILSSRYLRVCSVLWRSPCLRAQFAWRGDVSWGTLLAHLHPALDPSSSIQMDHLSHLEPTKLQPKWHLLSSGPVWKSRCVRIKACKCYTIFLSWGYRDTDPWEGIGGRWGAFSRSRIPQKQTNTLSTPTQAIFPSGWLISRQLPGLSTWLAELECSAQRPVFLFTICGLSSPTRGGVLTASSAAWKWLNWYFQSLDGALSPLKLLSC